MYFNTLIVIFLVIYVNADDNDTEIEAMTSDDITAELGKLNFNNEELEMLRTILQAKESREQKSSEISDTDTKTLRTAKSEESEQSNESVENSRTLSEVEPSDVKEELIDKNIDDDIESEHKVSTPDVMLDMKGRTGEEDEEVEFERSEQATPPTMMPPMRRTLGTGFNPSLIHNQNPYTNLFTHRNLPQENLSADVLKPEYNSDNSYPYSPYNFEGYVRPLEASRHGDITYNPYMMANRLMGGYHTPYRVT